MPGQCKNSITIAKPIYTRINISKTLSGLSCIVTFLFTLVELSDSGKLGNGEFSLNLSNFLPCNDRRLCVIMAPSNTANNGQHSKKSFKTGIFFHISWNWPQPPSLQFCYFHFEVFPYNHQQSSHHKQTDNNSFLSQICFNGGVCVLLLFITSVTFSFTLKRKYQKCPFCRKLLHNSAGSLFVRQLSLQLQFFPKKISFTLRSG